jgi:hypothetical protein
MEEVNIQCQRNSLQLNILHELNIKNISDQIYSKIVVSPIKILEIYDYICVNYVKKI